MPFSCRSIVVKCWHLYQALIAIAFVIYYVVEVVKYYQLTNIGSVFNFTSPIAKEEKTATEIVVQNFNISLFMDPGRVPLMAAITAYEEMNIASTLSSVGQPFLVKLTINDFKESKCFAAITHFYSWSKVLERNVTDTERHKMGKLKIGFDGDSFARTYLEELLDFEEHNMLYVSSIDRYEGEIWSINRAAAILELPDEKIFLSQHHNQFTAITSNSRFRGWNFVFKKGSTDISNAVLNLIQDDVLTSEEENKFVWGYRSEILAVKNYYLGFLIFGATSTVCLVYFLINLIKSYCCDQDEGNEDNLQPC